MKSDFFKWGVTMTTVPSEYGDTLSDVSVEAPGEVNVKAAAFNVYVAAGGQELFPSVTVRDPRGLIFYGLSVPPGTEVRVLIVW